MTRGTDILHFYYDAGGTPVAFKHNGTFYYYVTTLQGDVLLILDEDGEIVVSYDYDAWGKILAIGGPMASTLGTLNPLTYRGYVYDHETGLYYLQSRYYNPEWGRFLNADALVSTGGLLGNNMFAYCGNNPVTNVDPSGTVTENAIFAVCFGGSFPTPPPTEWEILIREAMAIGSRASISSGTISINMNQELDAILALEDKLSMATLTAAMAVGACEKYKETYGSEFLLADYCVAYEIQEHIYAYYWATGRKVLPNAIAVGHSIKQLLKMNMQYKGSVLHATVSIDIRETDVLANQGVDSQAFMFNYRDGIRKVHIGTERDPWASLR